MTNCSLDEEYIIDSLLHKLDAEDQEALNNHLDECESCRKLYYHWSFILSQESDKPPKKIKKRLMNEVIRKKPRVAPKKVFALTIALSTLLLTFMLGRYSTLHTHTYNKENNITNGLTYIPAESMSYKIVPLKNSEMQGYVWVNKQTKEMYMFIDGLQHMQGKDYQAWLISRDHRINGGVLKWDQDFAHMYVHSDDIPNIQQVIVSVEPHGGSQTPTGPKAFYVNFNN